MRVNGCKISGMARAPMVMCMRVIGWTRGDTARTSCDMIMVMCMRVFYWTSRKMARAPYDMPMVICMRVIGRTI